MNCPECGRECSSEHSLNGHIGAAHVPREQRSYSHGTVGGYLRHRRAKEPACGPCKVAWRRYYQKSTGRKPAVLRKKETVNERLARVSREKELERYRRYHRRLRERRNLHQTERTEAMDEMSPEHLLGLSDGTPDEGQEV